MPFYIDDPELEKEAEKIQLRSDEVQAILSFIPHWIIRWGITVIFITVAAVFVMSWFIKYPDVIVATISVTTENPPARLTARSGGRFVLLTEDNKAVQKDEVLGYIESPTKFQDANAMRAFIENLALDISKQNIIAASNKTDTIAWHLGTLQIHFANLSQSLDKYKMFEELQLFPTQIGLLNKQIENYQEVNQNLMAQRDLMGKELGLMQKQFGIDSNLLSKSVVTERELDLSKSGLIGKKRAFEGAQGSILNNKLSISQLQNQIAEMEIKQDDQHKQLLYGIANALEALDAQYKIWESQYVLKATTSGKVALLGLWSSNNFVNAGDVLLGIVPQEQSLYGNVYMPLANSGKVDIGQDVNIRFVNYPAHEYGVVRGKVENISLIPEKNNYVIRVAMPDGLKTTYKKELEFKQEMSGSAEIITEDLRLMMRIFNVFKDLFNKK